MTQAAHSSRAGTRISAAVFEQILNCARQLASSSDLHEVLGLIIDALRDTLHAERATVFQYDPERHELFATRSHGLPADLRLPADKGIIGEAARTRQIVNIPDAYADPRFNQAVDKQTGYRTRCLVTIPLIDFEQELVGVAQVLNKHTDSGGVFDEVDEVIATHLAGQAAVALKRASLLEARKFKQRLEADIEIARRIQQAGLPESLPRLPGYDIAAHWKAADETAGDSYDVIDIRKEAIRGPRLGSLTGDAILFMADATGHGIGPALSVTQVLSMLRMACRLHAPLEVLAQHINHQLYEDLPAGRFVTAFLGVLDTTAHTLEYVAAGQAPLLFIKASGPRSLEEECLPANTMPLGVDNDFNPDKVPPFRFDPGDVFVLLSDGYYEAADARGTLFGAQAVIDIVRRNLQLSAESILNEIRWAIVRFTGGAAPADDQTAIVVKRTE